MSIGRRPHPPTCRTSHRWAAALALTVSVSTLAACGSSGHSGSPTAAAGGGAGEARVAAARAFVAPYLTRPRKISLTTPVGKPIPTGKTVAYINCGTPICQHDGVLAGQAAKALGWKVDIVNTDGSPAQTANAWTQILRQHADGVLYQATPRAQINHYLLQAKSAGIKVVAASTPDAATGGIDYVIDGSAAFGRIGPVQAGWVVANSDGSPSVLYLNLPDFPILTRIESSFTSAFKQRCPSCSSHTLNVPLTAVGKNAPDLVVSYLRSHRSVKYLATSDDVLLVGLPAALKAAGLSGVKLLGQGPSTNNFQYLSTGQESASVVHPDYDDVFGGFDALARIFAGAPLPPVYNLPLWLITGKTLPSVKALDFPVVPDVIKQYEALWGKTV